MVALDRRRFLRSSAAAALSLTAPPDLIMRTAAAAAGDWDAGPVRLLLPTVSDSRMLIKISFDAPLSEAPTLRVVDNGPGVPSAERLRVFDRFYRSPQALALSEIGSGLGLAIVKAIADRHGAVVSLHAGRDGAGLEARVVFAAPG